MYETTVLIIRQVVSYKLGRVKSARRFSIWNLPRRRVWTFTNLPEASGSVERIYT